MEERHERVVSAALLALGTLLHVLSTAGPPAAASAPSEPPSSAANAAGQDAAPAAAAGANAAERQLAQAWAQVRRAHLAETDFRLATLEPETSLSPFRGGISTSQPCCRWRSC